MSELIKRTCKECGAENDIVLLKRESKICQYKVQQIQYFSPHSEEFFGELIWVGYEQ